MHTLLNEINQIGSQRGIDDLCSIYRETVGWSDTDPNMTFEQKVYHILLNVSPEAFEAFKSDVMRRLRQCDTEHSILSTLGNRYTFYKDTAEWSSTNKHKTLKECLRMVRSTTSQEELKTLRTDIIRTFAYQEVLQFLGVSHFALLEICPFNEAPTLSFQHCLFNIAIGTPEKALFLKAKITSIHPSLLSDLYKRKVREFLYPNTDFLATAVRVQRVNKCNPREHTVFKRCESLRGRKGI